MPSLFTASGLSFLRLCLLLIGGCVLYQAGADGWTRVRLARHGRLSQPTVVGLTEATDEDGPGYHLRLRFATATGATVSASSQYTYDSLAYRMGQAVALRYDPHDPPVCLMEAERTSWNYFLNVISMVPLFLYFRWLVLHGS